MASQPGGNSWRPGASRLALEARASLLAAIRSFFAARGVTEVETPLISRHGNSDPNIESITTGEHPARYLRTSPEYALKRLLCAGSGDIYELGRVFRSGETGRHHNPEFTLLEWYRLGMEYLDLADEVVELVRECGQGRFDDWPAKHVSYRDLFLEHCHLDPWTCTEVELELCAVERGITAPPMGVTEWLDLLLGQVVQPALPGHQLTIVHDFLPEQAALARIQRGDRDLAQRFEVFLGQVELANGYQELTNAREQQQRFERENRHREARGESAVPLDQALLEALRHGLPECSGVALGVDRLLMAVTGLDSMDAVLAFAEPRS
jgi:lysyl-tRNA synthetase class 2